MSGSIGVSKWGWGHVPCSLHILVGGVIFGTQVQNQFQTGGIEDFFNEFFQIEFEEEAEDGSLSKVARDLINLHEQCIGNNFTKLDHLSQIKTGEENESYYFRDFQGFLRFQRFYFRGFQNI
eukprot:TRINITY_DN6774_c0_g2_i2.p2 TRINITY_DN6774_c0_g2~~TRINITY_DN6774_c0_g2_i2.p2  ORF type:complete len:122 (-),score=16.69 TRINITY_DN6774_c0_g2_i2:214-579(-)